MGKAFILTLAILLPVAAATAGCFGGDDAAPPTNNTNTNNTGTNNTVVKPKATTGGDNITGGPNAMKSISIAVLAGHTSIAITFKEKGPQDPLPAVPVQSFMASLKDPKGNETATSSGTANGITQAVKAGQSGTWTLDVSFAASPTTTVEVAYTVS